MKLKAVWAQPLLTDAGTAFTAAKFAGFQLEVDGAAAVSIPVAWNDAGTYEFPLDSLALADGTHTLRVQTKHVNGTISGFSNAKTFTAQETPADPTGLDVVAA